VTKSVIFAEFSLVKMK